MTVHGFNNLEVAVKLDRFARLLEPGFNESILYPKPGSRGLSGNVRVGKPKSGDGDHDTDTYAEYDVYRLDASTAPVDKATNVTGVYNGTGMTLLEVNFAFIFRVDSDPDDPEKQYLAFPYELADCAPGFGIGAKSELTIIDGVVTKTGPYHRIAAQTGTTDTLTTINGGMEGQMLFLLPASGDTITFSDSANLKLAGNFVADSTQDMLQLLHNGSNWVEISRSNNG